MICFYGYSKNRLGDEGQSERRRHKRQGLVCVKKQRLNGPAGQLQGGFLLQNHRHYGANTHLGSSCGAAMDDHKITSSWHSSRDAFLQTAVHLSPCNGPPISLCATSECSWIYYFPSFHLGVKRIFWKFATKKRHANEVHFCQAVEAYGRRRSGYLGRVSDIL